MRAEEALTEWGKRKLLQEYPKADSFADVTVELEMGGGCPTCGSWPTITITGRPVGCTPQQCGRLLGDGRVFLDISSYEFAEVVTAVVDLARNNL